MELVHQFQVWTHTHTQSLQGTGNPGLAKRTNLTDSRHTKKLIVVKQKAKSYSSIV